ncbi:MAG TPA: hypothetical protein VN038_23900 [Dyadobacter sp.]|nr:hypothetical protein [Dyadobacter sp.]
MLKPVKILSLCIALCICHLSIGQKYPQTGKLKHKESLKNETAAITADQIIAKGDTITYLGNVSVTTKKITARKAEKVVFDQKANKITIWGSKEFRSRCRTIVNGYNLPEERVEYVLGSGLARVF